MSFSIVFPGQGSQYPGMGKGQFADSDLAKKIYATVDVIFAKQHKDSDFANHKISDISFNGPEEILKRTVFTQPAIIAHSLALAAELKEKIKVGALEKPLYVAGHSLGEFAALYMAGVLSLEDTLRLVVKRAGLMETAPAGAMTAVVGLDAASIDALLADIADASVANYNAPDQTVITGTKEAMMAAAEKINAKAEAESLKVRVIELPVGGAFHSPLMQAASDEFSTLIDAAEFQDAEIPVIQNVAAAAVTSADELKANLKKQMTGSVRWTETVATLLAESSEVWELGPGKVLAGLVKKQDRRFPVKSVEKLSDVLVVQ